MAKMINFSRYRLPFFFTIVFFIISGTFLAIKLAQGYRIDLTNKTLKPNGLLVATSTPPGAQVFVDGELKTATNNTLAIPPGKYTVEIKRSGFFPWKKELTIEKELVTQADALLFPQIPDLKPLTFLEIENPQLSPDGSKIVYHIPLPNPEAGLWVMDLTDFFFNLGREPRQIVKSYPPTRDFGKADYFWSPDSKQILVNFSLTGEKYLLDSSQLNSMVNLANMAALWPQTAETWEKESQLRQEARSKKIPEAMLKILANNTSSLSFSPDGTKVLYLATASAEIPEHLIPPVLAASTQPESRQIEGGRVYVYDIKEDKNFQIPFTPAPPTPTPKVSAKSPKPTPTPVPLPPSSSQFSLPRWLPTSRHLYWIENDKVVACEYDTTNLIPIYSGPFVNPFVFVSSSANRLVILSKTGIDSENKANLYSVTLR